MRQKPVFPCLQGIKMRRSTRVEQNMDVWSAIEKKFTALLKILFLKNFNLKINVKKERFQGHRCELGITIFACRVSLNFPILLNFF